MKSISWRSRATVQPILQELWRASRTKGRFVSGTSSLEAMLSGARTDNKKNVPPALANWLVVLDEFICLLTELYIAYFEAAIDRRGKKTDIARVTRMLLIGTVAADCYAIRLLVLSGYDVNAKQTARLMSEYVDVLILLLHRPDLYGEFHGAQDPSEANKFWHRYISKGKLRRQIRSLTNKKFMFSEKEIAQAERWEAEEMLILSAASHPSLIAAFMTVAHGGAHRKAGSGLFGNVDAGSIRTVSYCIHRLSELLLFADTDLLDFGELKPNESNRAFVRGIFQRYRFVLRLMAFVTSSKGRRLLNRSRTPSRAKK